MGTLLLRNIVTPACQIPGLPSLSSLRGRAGLYTVSEEIWLTAYAFMPIFVSNCNGSARNTEFSTFSRVRNEIQKFRI